jgi:membrane protease YdiL (CAAX protease family)
VLLNNDSEVNRRLAESLIAAWLLSEPRSVDAKIRSLGLRIVQKDLEKQWSEAGVLLAGGGLDDNTKSWVQGIRDSSGRTLSKMSAWEDMHKSDAPKPRVASRWLSGDLLPAPLAAAASVSVLLSLSLLTRFRRRYEVGIFLMLLWYFARLLFFNPLLAPSWVLAVYCPVAISILWVAVTGPKALPYFAEPESRHGFAGKTWLEAVGLCVLLLVGSAAFDTAFPWFYHQLAGVDLAEQSIIPLLKSELPSQILAMVLSVGLFYPVIEEILYRGFLHDWLSRKLPLGVAVVLGSSIFGFVHGVDHAMQTAMFGIACVWLRLRYQSLIPSMLLHALSNTAALFLHNWRG